MTELVEERLPAPKGVLSIAVRVVITVAVFVLIFRAIDLNAVWATLARIEPLWLVPALAAQFLSTGLAAYRWFLAMQPLGFGQRFGFYLRSYFKGAFFNQGLPTSVGGDAVRVIDLARTGHRKRDAFVGVLIDRAIGLVGLLLLNLIANTVNPDLLPPEVFLTINALVGGGLLGFLLLVGLRRWHAFERWPVMRLVHILSLRLGRVLAGGRQWATQLGFSGAVHLASLAGLYFIGRSVQLDYSFITYLIIVPPVILLTLIPISLAGWGIREGAMIGLFTLVGADKATVLSMSVLYGLTLILVSLPGFYVYLAGRHRHVL